MPNTLINPADRIRLTPDSQTQIQESKKATAPAPVANPLFILFGKSQTEPAQLIHEKRMFANDAIVATPPPDPMEELFRLKPQPQIPVEETTDAEFEQVAEEIGRILRDPKYNDGFNFDKEFQEVLKGLSHTHEDDLDLTKDAMNAIRTLINKMGKERMLDLEKQFKYLQQTETWKKFEMAMAAIGLTTMAFTVSGPFGFIALAVIGAITLDSLTNDHVKHWAAQAIAYLVAHNSSIDQEKAETTSFQVLSVAALVLQIAGSLGIGLFSAAGSAGTLLKTFQGAMAASQGIFGTGAAINEWLGIRETSKLDAARLTMEELKRKWEAITRSMEGAVGRTINAYKSKREAAGQDLETKRTMVRT